MQTTGNRDPYTPGELPPSFELIMLKHAGNPWQVRFGFSEHTISEEGQPPRKNFNYHYVDVQNLSEATLKSAGVPDGIWQQIATYDAVEEDHGSEEISSDQALKIILGDE